jgi:hypothetical protein
MPSEAFVIPYDEGLVYLFWSDGKRYPCSCSQGGAIPRYSCFIVQHGQDDELLFLEQCLSDPICAIPYPPGHEQRRSILAGFGKEDRRKENVNDIRVALMIDALWFRWKRVLITALNYFGNYLHWFTITLRFNTIAQRQYSLHTWMSAGAQTHRNSVSCTRHPPI